LFFFSFALLGVSFDPRLRWRLIYPQTNKSHGEPTGIPSLSFSITVSLSSFSASLSSVALLLASVPMLTASVRCCSSRCCLFFFVSLLPSSAAVTAFACRYCLAVFANFSLLCGSVALLFVFYLFFFSAFKKD